jgi:hypothetical protein
MSVKTTQDTTTIWLPGWSYLDLSNSQRDRWIVTDPIGWLIICAFGIWLMRAIVFSAITANSIGDSIWNKIQDFGQNFLKTMPIVPLWNGINWGVWTIFNTLRRKPDELLARRENQQEKDLWDVMESKWPKLFKWSEAYGNDDTANKVEADNLIKHLKSWDIHNVQTELQGQWLTTQALTSPEVEKAIAGLQEEEKKNILETRKNILWYDITENTKTKNDLSKINTKEALLSFSPERAKALYKENPSYTQTIKEAGEDVSYSLTKDWKFTPPIK